MQVGKTLSDREWIGMCRREIFDDYLRKRATGFGAKVSYAVLPVLCLLLPPLPDASSAASHRWSEWSICGPLSAVHAGCCFSSCKACGARLTNNHVLGRRSSTG